MQLLRWWGKCCIIGRIRKQNSYVKEYSLPDCEAGLFIEPGVTAASSFWKFCLNKSISESIILIKSPLKWDKIFLYWNPVITMIFLYWLYYLQNQTKKLSQLSLCIVCRKIVLNRRALNVLENLKENRKNQPK